MSSYPQGERPEVPFSCHTEVMTGFEYTAAVGMIYDGQIAGALKCINAIRDRYDGQKRNPYDEAECGHHYVRAMMSWGAVLALTGFHYTAVEKNMSMGANLGNHFWSNGYAWGQCRIRETKKGFSIKLKVIKGNLSLRSFILKGIGTKTFKKQLDLSTGKSVRFTI